MAAPILRSTFLAAALLTGMSLPTLHAADADKTLHDFLATEWNYTLEQHPTLASNLGDRRFNDRWEDESLAAIDARYAHDRQALDTLKSTVDRAALTPADQLNYDLYARNLQTDLEGQKFHFYLCPLNQRGGIQNADEILEDLRVSTPQDYQDWLGRLEKLPTLIQQNIDLMKEGIKEHIVLPKVVMSRVPAQIAKQVVDKPEDSPFFKPFKQIPDSFTPEQKADLIQQADIVIGNKVIPAYRDFQKFFETEYLPACYDGVGVWQMPNGQEAYAYFARQETTTGPHPRADPPDRPDEVARIHGGDGDRDEDGGFQRHDAGVLPLSPHRP